MNNALAMKNVFVERLSECKFDHINNYVKLTRCNMKNSIATKQTAKQYFKLSPQTGKAIVAFWSITQPHVTKLNITIACKIYYTMLLYRHLKVQFIVKEQQIV